MRSPLEGDSREIDERVVLGKLQTPDERKPKPPRLVLGLTIIVGTAFFLALMLVPFFGMLSPGSGESSKSMIDNENSRIVIGQGWRGRLDATPTADAPAVVVHPEDGGPDVTIRSPCWNSARTAPFT
jgi:hypothetical protein